MCDKGKKKQVSSDAQPQPAHADERKLAGVGVYNHNVNIAGMPQPGNDNHSQPDWHIPAPAKTIFPNDHITANRPTVIDINVDEFTGEWINTQYLGGTGVDMNTVTDSIVKALRKMHEHVGTLKENEKKQPIVPGQAPHETPYPIKSLSITDGNRELLLNSVFDVYSYLREKGFSVLGAAVTIAQRTNESGWVTSKTDKTKHNYFGMLNTSTGKKLTYNTDQEGYEAWLKMMNEKFSDALSLLGKSNSFTSDDYNRVLGSGPYQDFGKVKSYDYDPDDSEPIKLDWRDPKKPHKWSVTGMKNYGGNVFNTLNSVLSRWVPALDDVIAQIDKQLAANSSGIVFPYSEQGSKDYIKGLIDQKERYLKVLIEISSIQMYNTGTNLTNNKTQDEHNKKYANQTIKYKDNILRAAISP